MKKQWNAPRIVNVANCNTAEASKGSADAEGTQIVSLGVGGLQTTVTIGPPS